MKTVIEMVREAADPDKVDPWRGGDDGFWVLMPGELERFAALVRADEREARAKRIAELEALLERQTARIVDLQTHIENFDGEDR